MKARLAAVQYGLRRVASWDDFEDQVWFFAEHAAEEGVDFLLYPEFLSTQLLSLPGSPTEPAKAMRGLLDYTERYVKLFTEIAKDSGAFVVGGTHPTEGPNGRLRNTAFMFTPNGPVVRQDKLHLTPWEAKHWGMEGGDSINVIQTPKAKVGVLVCYDAEFPELGRILAEEGVEILLVPASTDDRRGHVRVRDCCAARAIENQFYVVQAGTVGLLPKVSAMRMNCSRAAIHTPSDYPFPWNAIAAEAEFNDETSVIADVDLDTLAEVRERGSVTNSRDKRPELYETVCKMPIHRHRIGRVGEAEPEEEWEGAHGGA